MVLLRMKNSKRIVGVPGSAHTVIRARYVGSELFSYCHQDIRSYICPEKFSARMEVALQTWLLFLYRVQREPSSHRVTIWRQLKRSGAMLLHDAVWVLPMTPENLRYFQKLYREVAEAGGNALLWEAYPVHELLTGAVASLASFTTYAASPSKHAVPSVSGTKEGEV